MVRGGLIPGVKCVEKMLWMLPCGAITCRISPRIPPSSPPMSTKMRRTQGDFLTRYARPPI